MAERTHCAFNSVWFGNRNEKGQIISLENSKSHVLRVNLPEHWITSSGKL